MSDTQLTTDRPRVRLTVVSDEGDGPCFAFDAAPGAIRIGRAMENDIVLSDERVSRVHARITIEADHCAIEDLRSRTGVAINGEVIAAPRPLRSGDLIRCGGSLLRFETDPVVPEPVTEEARKPLLMLMVSAMAEREPQAYPLAAGEYSIGREPSCNIILPGEAVSRYHVRLSVSAEGCKAVDLGSGGGTLLNGAPLGIAQSVRSGDILRIGPYALQLAPMIARDSGAAHGAGRRIELEQTIIASSAQLRARGAEFYLVCLSGGARGMRYPLADTESLVGSSAACRPRLSGVPEHALTMKRDGEGFLLLAGGDAAAIRVSGGRKLSCRIVAGDLIDIGGQVYRLIREGDVFAAKFDPAEFNGGQRARRWFAWLLVGLIAATIAASIVLLRGT